MKSNGLINLYASETRNDTKNPLFLKSFALTKVLHFFGETKLVFKT